MNYFLVYHDNSNNYTFYINQLLESVNKYGKNFKIILFSKGDIDEDFLEKNKNIFSHSKGGGYWLWKPYIINETLKKINDNDVLFYLDSKYYFTEDFENLYIDKYIKNNDLILY